MRQILTIVLLIYFSNLFGQFALVADKDRFVNVREKGVKNSKILDQLQNGHLIYCFENNGNWTNIDYDKNGKEGSGYVYKDRYQWISDFPEIPISNNSNSTVTFKKDTIEISISQSKFDRKKHTFQYVKGYPTQIDLIDNKPYWGMDGGMPTTQFEKVIIKIGQKTIELPKKSLQGLYQPDFHGAQVNYDAKNQIIYIQTANSDGAGSYLAIWKVEKGIYKDRLIAYGF